MELIRQLDRPQFSFFGRVFHDLLIDGIFVLDFLRDDGQALVTLCFELLCLGFRIPDDAIAFLVELIALITELLERVLDIAFYGPTMLADILFLENQQGDQENSNHLNKNSKE